jgi:hypothetical protein
MIVFVFDYVTFNNAGGKSNLKYYYRKTFDQNNKKQHELTYFNNKHIRLLKNCCKIVPFLKLKFFEMKALVIIILIFSSFTLSAQVDSIKINSQLILTKPSESQDISQVIDSVLDFGKTLIGCRYRYGGLSVAGFDCSGFMKYIFQKYGIALPHCSREYIHVGEVISKDSIGRVRKGDFLIFKGRNSKSKRIGHVAIVIEVNEKEIKMIHSCCDKGVAIENYLISPYYLKRLIEIRRLKETI